MRAVSWRGFEFITQATFHGGLFTTSTAADGLGTHALGSSHV